MHSAIPLPAWYSHDHECEFFTRLGMPRPSQPFPALLQQLMSFRNERHLHRRKCDLSGKEILSAYPPGTPFPVYKNDLWWGDSWDPSQYGQPIDFSRPFFEQFAQLQSRVPREGTSVFNSENCDYNGHIRESKNCYMNALVYRCEDTHYSYWVVGNKDVLDSYMVNNSTLCYDCMDCDRLYECVGLQECVDCRNCYFSFQLQGCTNCIGCHNLANKQYYVSNQAVSPERFRQIEQQLFNGSRAGLEQGMQLFEQSYNQAEHRALHNLKCEDVVGDHLRNSRRCFMTFDGQGGEDVYFSVSIGEANDVRYCYSAGWPRCEQVYLSSVTRGSSNIACCYYTYFSSDLRYCDSSMSCKSCFGCVGMRRAENSILNRSYTRHEYQQLTEKLVAMMKETGEWGEFFPPTLSTFSYNDTAAQDYFPLKKDAALKAGWRWRDENSASSAGTASVPPATLDQLKALPANSALRCQVSGKPYRVIPQEIEFYSKMNLPPPWLCPDVRHDRRKSRRTPFEIHQCKCAISGAEVPSAYAPSRPERVVSEESFLAALR